MSRRIPGHSLAMILRLAVVTWIAAMVVACGGPSEPSGNPAHTPDSVTTVAPPSKPSPSSQEDKQDTRLEQAVLAYLRSSLSVPYKEVRVDVVSQDDAFATVEVHAQLRPTVEAD